MPLIFHLSVKHCQPLSQTVKQTSFWTFILAVDKGLPKKLLSSYVVASIVVNNIMFCHTHSCIHHSALMGEGERLSHVLIEVIRMNRTPNPAGNPSILPFKYS